jgi:hypothetical protein
MPTTQLDPLAIGTPLPSFRLADPVRGTEYATTDLAPGQGLLVMVICNHCPYVVHLRAHLAPFAARYAARGIPSLAVSANDPEAYPEDAPQRLAAVAREQGFGFPYLYDESQSFVRSLHAACTPEFYLFDGTRRLYYRGRFDGSTPGNGRPVTGEDLAGAIESLLRGDPPPAHQQPAIGCSIKWRTEH